MAKKAKSKGVFKDLATVKMSAIGLIASAAFFMIIMGLVSKVVEFKLPSILGAITYIIYSSIFWLWVPLLAYSIYKKFAKRLNWGIVLFFQIIIVVLVNSFLLGGLPPLIPYGLPIFECFPYFESPCGIIAFYLGFFSSAIGLIFSVILSVVYGIRK